MKKSDTNADFHNTHTVHAQKTEGTSYVEQQCFVALALFYYKVEKQLCV